MYFCRKLLEKSGQKEETKLETNEKDESRDAENLDEEITKSTTATLLPEKITAANSVENSPDAEIKELRIRIMFRTFQTRPYQSF